MSGHVTTTHDITSTDVTLPCPTCNEDGFVSFGDRHVENRKEVCPSCGGRRRVPANTGLTPHSSFKAEGPGRLSVDRVSDVGNDVSRVEVVFNRRLTDDEADSLERLVDLFCAATTGGST